MSLYDFYMYLKYIEFSAENLEFYIWFVVLYFRRVCILLTSLQVQELREGMGQDWRCRQLRQHDRGLG